MYGISNIYILRRDGLLFDGVGKYRAQRTQAEKQKVRARIRKNRWPVKQLFPVRVCGGTVGRPGAVGGKQKTGKAEGARKAHNSIRTRLKSIFWCWQYKLSGKAEKRLKRRKTALKRKAEKAEDGKRRKAGSGKQEKQKSRKSISSRK